MDFRRLTLSGIAALPLVFGSSQLLAGDPLINLGWFLQDTVVATVITEEEHLAWRTADALSAEMELRQRTDADAVWIERLPTKSDIGETSCEDFDVSRFSDWAQRNGQDLSSVPQWREAWHGVSALAHVDAPFWLPSRVRRIEFVAAVKDPGIPETAFEPNRGRAIHGKYFEIASVYRSAGFHRMAEIVQPLTMVLTNQSSCEGFTIYHWVFERWPARAVGIRR